MKTEKIAWPHSVDIERSVLGSMALDPDALEMGVDVLQPDRFHVFQHRVIFEHMVQLHQDGKPVDLVTLTDHMEAAGDLKKVGGSAYVSQILTDVPTAANFEGYVKALEAYWLRRRVMAEALAAYRRAERDGDADQLLDEVQSAFVGIVSGKPDSSVELDRILPEWMDDLEDRQKQGGRMNGLRTGFYKLDAMTTGLQPGQLVVMAARPSMGKSALAINMAINAAVKYNTPGILFSLEMDRHQVVRRMVAVESGVPLYSLKLGLVKDSWDKITDAAGRLYQKGITIDDRPDPDLGYVRQAIRRARHKRRIGWVIVDYLQLMVAPSMDTREQQVAAISRGLKAIAREFEVPLIALSQLSRAVEQRAEKIPQLSDLRESGSIEQEADIVMFLYRDEYYNKTTSRPGITDLIVAKQRDGEVGTVELRWNKETTRFYSVETERRAG